MTKSIHLFGTLSVCLYLAVSTPALAVEPFVLNWQQQKGSLTGQADFRCNMGVADAGQGCSTTGSSGFGNYSDPDKTPFLQEIVTGADGKSYYHIIMGSVDSSGNPIVPSAATQSTIPFAQEVYIARQSGFSANCVAENCSFSGGDINGFTGGGNGFDPLKNNMTSASTGNRTGFPTRVLMKDILNDGQISQVFLKDTLADKPTITQTITSKDAGGITNMTAQFSIDMSNSKYNDNTKAGLITNKLTFAGANANIPGNFDTNGPDNSFVTANTQIGKTNVTGGRYTFVEGSAGDSDTFGQGTYTYVTGDDAAANLDWNAFRNEAENPLRYGTSTTTRNRSGDICKSSTIGSVPTGC